MKHIKIFVFCLLAFVAFTPDQFAQRIEQEKPIVLSNPSFEDRPHIGKPGDGGPRGWKDCGKAGETPVDIQPSPIIQEAFFDVTTAPHDGKTYVGMVVRDNNTWEAISQRLRTPIESGKCYNFSLSLSHSKTYKSISRRTNMPVDYTKGAVIRIWGGSGYCSKLELLDESPQITNTSWKTYNFRLEPARNYSYIMIEAFYKTPVMFEYNGNVLVDNASNIDPVPCDDAPLVSVTEPVDKKKDPKQNTPNEKPNNDVVIDEPANTGKIVDEPIVPKKKEIIKELNDDVVEGQEIKLDKLYFKADSSSLRKEDLPMLDEIYYFLLENEKIVVELGGHTNNRCEDTFCNQLSEARAKAVADYLVKKGISRSRVAYKGYGKNKQKYPNNTPTNRRRNQRVELKIISKG